MTQPLIINQIETQMTDNHSVILLTHQNEVTKIIETFLDHSSYVIKGISRTIEEAHAFLKHHAPDFLIINRNHPCSNISLHSLKITSPRTRILVIEQQCSHRNIFTLIQAGADSYLSLPFTRKELISTLDQLTKEEIYLPSFIAKAILEQSQWIGHRSHQYPFILTEKDRAILACLARGMELDAIETCLNLGKSLIRAHITNIVQKIHFSDIVHKHLSEKLPEVKAAIETYELT